MAASSRPFAAVALVLTCAALFGQPRRPDKGAEVDVERSWKGEVPLARRASAPAAGFVADKAAWARLWKAFRGDEAAPDVDFAKELVLVAVNKDPNPIALRAYLDGRGNLTVERPTGRALYPDPKASKYQFAVVKRTGVKKVQGQGVPPVEETDGSPPP